MTSVNIKGVDVPCSAENEQIDILEIITKFRYFRDWIASLDDKITIKHIHFQNVDKSGGGKIMFVKFKCQAYYMNEPKPIPGIILLRGGAVSCLIELICGDKTFGLLVQQPRLAVGRCTLEAVAGMLDQDKVSGAVMKEVEEETGIVVQYQDLIDRTKCAHGEMLQGMESMVGLSDEYLRLYLCRLSVTSDEMKQLEGRITGLRDHGEYITLKILPWDQIWRETPDAKTLCSMFLREQLMKTGEIRPPIPYSQIISRK
ncbi:MAG: nudix hydrolase [Streblomastix strix]|uniref:Nudix hydrolase n=1 Tax=Streblomastix strix TaxID=222440 RepID=A0A5J4U3J6_9EUKA|nr:MAG: nudix hydrolase [Streblomastix strix]